MINLLPESQESVVMGEYRRRLIVVTLSLFTFVCFLSLLFLLPSFILSGVKLKSLSERAALFSDKKLEEGDSAAALTRLEGQVALMKTRQERRDVGTLIDTVIARKGGLVVLKGFSYERRGETSKLDVNGTAKTRAALIAFVDRLKEQKEFSEVYSPVSNLVKDRDIDFTVQIGIAR